MQVKARDVQSMIDSMTLEKVPVSSLVLWEDNPRVHGDDIEALIRSIGGFGWTNPILAQRGTNRVIAGHGRCKAALAKQLEVVPVIFLDYDDQEAAAYTIADNALAEKSSWDFSKLSDILSDLSIEGFDLSLTGMEDFDFDKAFEVEAIPTSSVAPVSALKQHPMDYRVHTAEELDHVAENIAKHGLYRDVVTASDGTILSGQEIVAAAQRAGIKDVPIKKLNVEPADPEALKLLIGDRETQKLAEVDDRKLTNLLVEIDRKSEDGLVGTGYDKPKVAALLLNTRTEGEVKDVNAASQWVGLPEYEESPDIYKITINFKSIEDRDRFCEMAGITIENRNRNTAACWWPEREREDISSVGWE